MNYIEFRLELFLVANSKLGFQLEILIVRLH